MRADRVLRLLDGVLGLPILDGVRHLLCVLHDGAARGSSAKWNGARTDAEGRPTLRVIPLAIRRIGHADLAVTALSRFWLSNCLATEKRATPQFSDSAPRRTRANTT